jgi:hypothetical protein
VCVLGMLALAVACHHDPTQVPQAGGQLSLGTWGGNNAGVIATDSVTHVHIGCTYGDIPGTVDLDAQGRFSRPGSYLLRAFPVAAGPTMPAQFSGQVIGNTLTLSIAVDDTVQKQVVPLGPVTVILNRDPQMGPCPICRNPRREGVRIPPMPPIPVSQRQPGHQTTHARRG